MTGTNTTPPGSNNGAGTPATPVAPCPCPKDFILNAPCRIVKVGGQVMLSAAEMPGAPAGNYTWTSPSAHLRIVGGHAATVTVTGLTAGGGRDSEMITVVRNAPSCAAITKTVPVTVAKVVFSKSAKPPDQLYGYDDFDTPANTDDDHISVERLKHTFVKVDITGGALGTDFDFACDDATVCVPAPPVGAASFELQLDAKDKDKDATPLKAKVKCPSHEVFAQIQVHVYKEAVLNVVVGKFFDSTSPGTALRFGGEDYSTATAMINPKAKEAVVKYSITNYPAGAAQTDVRYDLDNNGALSYDIAARGGAEFRAIASAMTGTGTAIRIAIVKQMKSYYYLASAAPIGATTLTITDSSVFSFTGGPLGTGTNQENVSIASTSGSTITLSSPTTKAHAAGEGIEFPAGGWGSDPIVIIEGTSSVDIIKWTFFHETGHRVPEMNQLLDVVDANDIMNFSQGWTDHRLRYCPRTLKYSTGTENQWDKIPR